MKKLLLGLMLLSVAALAEDQRPKAPEPPKPPVEQLKMEDVQQALQQIGADLAGARLQIISLQRQLREWQARALAAESKGQACVTPPDAAR